MRDPLPNRFVRLLVLVLCAAAYPAAAQQVVYVAVNATGPGQDGATWCTAYRDLQDALAAANPGDTIRVAEGIYTPDRGTGDRTANFPLLNRVALRGGFAGCGATDPDTRDIALYETILSGDLEGDDAVNFVNRSDNSYHVASYSDPNATGVVLDGFTITGGYADGTGPAGSITNQGPGIHIRDGSVKCISGGPTIRNCIIRDNWAAHHGAINDHGLATVIENCVIRDNYAGAQGAGLLIHSGSNRVTNCTFVKNITDGDGGAVWTGHDNNPACEPQSMPIFTNCMLVDNVARNTVETLSGRGGGMFHEKNQPTVTDCIFRGNEAPFRGGGLYADGPSIDMIRCSFTENVSPGVEGIRSSGSGGGAWLGFGTVSVSECLFEGNRALPYGGGLACDFAFGTIERCTFQDNYALARGGGLRVLGGSLTVVGCTFDRNRCIINGGGLSSEGSDANTKVFNCAFRGNHANNWGGAIMMFQGRLLAANCLFTGNNANREGGAVRSISGAVSTFVNCTFAGNNPGWNRPIISLTSFKGLYPNDMELINCILWNSPGSEILIEDSSRVTITYSDVRGGWPGLGNITLDPAFADADGLDDVAGTPDDNVRLNADSPAVDAGDNSALPGDLADLDGDGDTSEPLPVDLTGNPRIVGALVEMGAYERLDCNENEIDDTLDILAGTSQDCDGNGVPDECDSDCNGNGVADACESDSDGDGSIDDCDLCPDDGSKTAPVLCGCGVPDDDSDDDTVPDCNDVCPGADDLLDSDGDGVADGCDSCNGADDTLDCNHNGYADPCEVFDGVAPDLDGNGVPDDCDIMPHTAGEGCRALGVTPAPTGQPMALRLTSQDFPCLDQFLAADGSFTDSPVFLTSDEWGLVIVAHEQIIPSTRYAVTAELVGGAVSAQSWITTPPWGDVVGSGPGTLPDGNVSFSDIGAVVDCFKEVLTAPPLHRCDIWPAAPDGAVNFSDIGAAVEGFKSLRYPYAGPCP